MNPDSKRASGYVATSQHPVRGTRLIMKLHLVHHWFPLCRVHNGEMRARSINNGRFASTLSRALLLRSQGYGSSIRDHRTVYRGIRRTGTIVSLRLHYYILGYKRIRRISSGVKEVVQTSKREIGLPVETETLRPTLAGIFAVITPLGLHFRNKSAIASAG